MVEWRGIIGTAYGRSKAHDRECARPSRRPHWSTRQRMLHTAPKRILKGENSHVWLSDTADRR